MNEQEKTPLRKEGRKRGEITQKMVTFRCDADNVEWLKRQPNKGRYINNLIAMDKDGH